jgi:hypothetical protein
MCFNQPMSLAFAIGMWTVAAVWKGPAGARACMAYFAFMETLQAMQYSVINECENPVNKVLTVLGFIHLAFQPFFANLYLGCFMTKKQQAYVPIILCLTALGGVLMVNRMWTTAGDIPCHVRVEPMCGLATCTFRGNVHLAWQMPLQHADQDYFTPGFNLHFVMFYLPTFALGMYGTTIFLLLSGPFLGRVFTQHQDEIPAIWCFFSIMQVVFPLANAWLRKQHMFGAAANTVGVVDRTGSNGTLAYSASASNGVAYTNGHTNGVHTNGHVAKPAHSDDNEPDPIGGWRGIVTKMVILAAFLSVKRYAVIQLQPVQFPDAVAAH